MSWQEGCLACDVSEPAHAWKHQLPENSDLRRRRNMQQTRNKNGPLFFPAGLPHKAAKLVPQTGSMLNFGVVSTSIRPNSANSGHWLQKWPKSWPGRADLDKARPTLARVWPSLAQFVPDLTNRVGQTLSRCSSFGATARIKPCGSVGSFAAPEDEVHMETGAGAAAGFSDAAYAEVGCSVNDRGAVINEGAPCHWQM